MAGLRKHFDRGSIAVILLTFALFILALFTTGFTHDLLLEAGVFLVSVKLIIMSYKSGTATDDLRDRLDEIQASLAKLSPSISAPTTSAAPSPTAASLPTATPSNPEAK